MANLRVGNVQIRMESYGNLGASEGICRINSKINFQVSLPLFRVLPQRLIVSLKGLPGFGSSEWFLPTGDGFSLRIRMKYDDPDFEIHDHGLSSYLAATRPQSKDSLLEFLKQFHDINSRWDNQYGPVTENAIILCAEIQEDTLSRTSQIPANLSEEILLIALSLRALAFAHNFTLFEWNFPWVPHVETFFLQPKMIRDKNPSLEVWRCDPATESESAFLGHDGGGQLSSMIEDIVRITQRLHFRRRPKDWPSLFCVLCLLKLILDEIRLFDTFNCARDALESVLSMLCQLYHVCTKGNHPLTHDWSVEEYTSLVENDTLAIAHFRLLNDTWVEGTSTSFLCTTILRLLTNIVKAGGSVMMMVMTMVMTVMMMMMTMILRRNFVFLFLDTMKSFDKGKIVP
jgi:hypothetical protein